MAIVSTGQITIVDTNDARTLTAVLTSSSGLQQIYTKNESTTTYIPNWHTASGGTSLEIKPQISISGLTSAEILANLTTRKFTYSADPASTAITTASNGGSNGTFVTSADVTITDAVTITNTASRAGSVPTLTINGNLSQAVGTWTVYFHGTFNDPSTGLDTSFSCQITLSTIKTGTNAVYVLTRGKTDIEESFTSTKNATAIAVDLVRTSGIDTTDVGYRFFENSGTTIIDAGVTNVSTKYGFLTTAPGSAPSATNSNLNSNLPATSTLGWSSNNTLVIGEAAVADFATFKAEVAETVGVYTSDPTITASGGGATTQATFTPVRVGNGLIAIRIASAGAGYTSAPTITITGGGAGGATAKATISSGAVTGVTLDGQTIYTTFFTISDISDPYDVKVFSTAGDKFLNGVGRTTLKPYVSYGGTPLSDTDISAWKFRWRVYYDDNQSNAAANLRSIFIPGGLIKFGTDATPTGGWSITNSTGANKWVITVTDSGTTFGTARRPVVGDLVKVVTAGKLIKYAEVSAVSSTGVTLRNDSTNLTYTTSASILSAGFPANITVTDNEFLTGSRMFLCWNGQNGAGPVTGTATGASGFENEGRIPGAYITTGATALEITDAEIDVRGRIEVQASRP